LTLVRYHCAAAISGCRSNKPRSRALPLCLDVAPHAIDEVLEARIGAKWRQDRIVR
jgi:hypothetical protein